MKEIILSQNKIALIDDDDWSVVSAFEWFAIEIDNTFYARRRDGSKSIYLHRFLLGVTDSTSKVDHINLNGLDNRRENLRICTHAQNIQNSPKTKMMTTSQFKGVYWNNWRGRWMAYILIDKKKKYLGYFVDEIDAAKAYDKAATKAFGEFSRVNFPA